MKFTAFVLASAAVTASAQYFPGVGYPGVGYPGVGYPGVGYPSGVAYAPYQAQVMPAYPYPVQQPYPVQPYPVVAPAPVDPLAWERDCTWINSVNFRAALSRATCGADVCSVAGKGPNGNGGGWKRTVNGVPARAVCCHDGKLDASTHGASANACDNFAFGCSALTSNTATSTWPLPAVGAVPLPPAGGTACTAAQLTADGKDARCAQKPSMATTAKASTLTDGNHVWGTVINRAGRVCAVAYTGPDLSQQFPYGRIQSMKRANTANSLSIPQRAMPSHITNRHEVIAPGSNEEWNHHVGLGQGNHYALGLLGQDTNMHRLSTANTVASIANSGSVAPKDGQAGFYAAEHNGGSPFHRQHYNDNAWNGFSHDRFNPGNLDVLYQGAASNYGEACGTNRQDPMCMQKPGGYDYSAGGLALYDATGVLRGAIGVAGDNDCASHAIAWKAREQLAMDYTPANKDRSINNGNVHMTPAEKLLRETPKASNHLFSYVNCKNDGGHSGLRAGSVLIGAATVVPPSSPVVTNPAIQSFIHRKAGQCTLARSDEGREAWTGNRIKQRLDIWAHTGAKAEDNVVFLPDEVRNFPACYYDVVKKFQTTNPTENPLYGTAK